MYEKILIACYFSASFLIDLRAARYFHISQWFDCIKTHFLARHATRQRKKREKEKTGPINRG